MKREVKNKTPMEKLTSGYENFIKDKQIEKKGKSAFDKAIKKAAKPKPRGSK